MSKFSLTNLILRGKRNYIEASAANYALAAPRTTPSIARDALIVAINPHNGKIWNNATYTVPSAVMLELAHEGRISVSGTSSDTKITVDDPTPLGVQELDDAMILIEAGTFGQKVTRFAEYISPSVQLIHRLVKDGIITEETYRWLGIFKIHRYYPTSAAGYEELVARLQGALLGKSAPDNRTALLISSLIDVPVKLFVPKDKVKEANQRVQEIRKSLSEGEQSIVHAAGIALSNSNNYSSSVAS